MPAVRDWRFTLDDGAAIAGDDRGPATAPAIVLLHGLASTRRWWDLVAPRLAGSHRVVRLDLRGHGGSDAPPDGYTVDGLAADVVQVVAALGLPSTVVAGHSLGAAVALRVGAARPDLTTAIACVDGGVYDPRLMFGVTWPQARSAMVHARRGQTTVAVLRSWLAGAGLPAEALDIVAANYVDTGAGGLRLRLDPEHEDRLAHSLWSVRDPLAGVRARVLAVAARTGEPLDAARAESLRRLQSRHPDRLRVTWLPGGHDLPLHHPASLAVALAHA